MADILFEVLKLVVMILTLVVIRYVVPFVRNGIDTEKMEVAMQWVERAVLHAQQVFDADSGAEKKAIVTQFLKQILTEKNIALSDEQLDILIEAAVKEMKIQEAAGVTVSVKGEVQKE